mgnify:FL=1
MTGKTAKVYVTACLLVFAVSLGLLLYQSGKNDTQAGEAAQLPSETGTGQENYLQYDEALEENTLLLQLPEGVTQQDIELQSDCMAQKVTLCLKKEIGGTLLDRRYFREHPIQQNISCTGNEIKEEQDKILFTIALNQPQEASVQLRRGTTGTEAEIRLQTPSALYDRIVVLDAGHGGNDAGETVVVQDMSLQEKDIALTTVKKAGELLLAQGIRVYYTREDDSSRSMEERVEFANALQADMLISVHVTSAEDTTVYGIQTEYNAQYFIPDFSSADLAYLLLTKVAEATNEKALDIIPGEDDNAVIRDAIIPVTQLDMGFLSNQQERKLLQKDAYTEKVAQGICDAVLLAYKEMGK